MKLAHLNLGQVDEFAIQSTDQSPFPPVLDPGLEIQLRYSPQTNLTLLQADSQSWAIQCDEPAQKHRLQHLLSLNPPRVAWILARSSHQRLHIQLHTFPFEITGMDCRFALDDDLLSAAQKLNPKARTIDNCISWLTDQCILSPAPGDNLCRIFISGPRDEEDADAFIIHGRSIQTFIKRHHDEEQNQEIWKVEKIIRQRPKNKEGMIALATGTLSFTDHTRATLVRTQIQTQLDQLRGSHNKSFIKLWETYDRIELQQWFDECFEFGALPYKAWAHDEDGNLRFTLETSTALSPNDLPRDLSILEQLPPFLKEKASVDEIADLDPSQLPAEVLTAAVEKIKSAPQRRLITLKSSQLELTPPQQGFLVPPLRGYLTNRSRRLKAREAIASANTPLPHLPLLLEGQTQPWPRPPEIPALSPAVVDEIFGGTGPNPSQERAIWAALNTPDIAIIQGPPGTGKTTVIRAIVARLDEIHADSKDVPPKILLSGFQHEAVENVVERVQTHGVPSVKIGGSSGQDGYRAAMGNLEVDRQKILKKLRENLQPNSPSALSIHLEELRQSYLLATRPPQQTILLLDQVMDLAGEHLSIKTRKDLREIKAQLQRSTLPPQHDADRARHIQAVRALRHHPITFEDDGPQNAARLLLLLTQSKFAKDRGLQLAERDDDLRLLQSLAYQDIPPTDEELRQSENLQRRLLKLLIIDPTQHRRATLREDVSKLLTRVVEEFRSRTRSYSDSIDGVAAEFYDTTSRNPHEFAQAIHDLTTAWGATCQQAASLRLARAQEPQDLEYDTVIVDEAARANPLDLFIPMTQARRRIILVGDHRQLPHIIDQQLEKKLQKEFEDSQDDQAVQKWFHEKLKESLFEHLQENLQDRQSHDNFPYTVSLNEQYRMHPRLGDFISKNFYQSQLKSPRGPQDFQHSLPKLAQKVALWLDVPNSLGQEQNHHTSKARQIEARALVTHLKKLIEHTSAKDLSFGVITYYAGQRELLFDELCIQGLATRNDDGQVEIIPEYRYFQGEPAKGERLRVGTVDAFQGREFDVVFLSLVRSNKLPDKTVPQKRRKYGHIMSPNRLNVSMSRQKRLLIVVGDSTLLKSPHAKSAIGPLVDFYEDLCKSPDGHIQTWDEVNHA